MYENCTGKDALLCVPGCSLYLELWDWLSWSSSPKNRWSGHWMRLVGFSCVGNVASQAPAVQSSPGLAAHGWWAPSPQAQEHTSPWSGVHQAGDTSPHHHGHSPVLNAGASQLGLRKQVSFLNSGEFCYTSSSLPALCPVPDKPCGRLLALRTPPLGLLLTASYK